MLLLDGCSAQAQAILPVAQGARWNGPCFGARVPVIKLHKDPVHVRIQHLPRRPRFAASRPGCSVCSTSPYGLAHALRLRGASRSRVAAPAPR